MPVEKIIFTTKNGDDALKDLQGGQQPGFRNLLVYSDNVSGVRRKNVPGTLKLADFPVSSQADCRGAAYYQPTNKSYFFFKDLSFGDSIIEYDVTLDVCTLLVRDEDFNFEQVNDISIVGNLIYWNDAVNNLRKINILQAKNHLYDGSNFSEIGIALLRKQPILPPTGLRATDPLKSELNPAIRRIAFQFATRYAYLDGEFSPLSNVSAIFPPSRNEALTNADNFIQLTLHVDKDIKPYITHLELIARIGNAGPWFRYDKIDVGAFTTVSNDAVTGFQRLRTLYSFYNDKSGPQLGVTETDPFFMSVPRESAAQALTQDRLFLTDTLAREYDLEETEWSASVQVTHVIDQTALKALCNQTKPRPDYLLGLSRYGSGAVFFDRFGARAAVSSRPGLNIFTPANINYRNAGGGPLLANPEVISAQTSMISAAIQFTGKPPSWAWWVAPARTNNLTYLWWQAAKCRIQFPRSTAPTSQDEPTSSAFYLDGGYEYFDLAKYWHDIWTVGAAPIPDGFGAIIDITLPPDFPYAIDTDVLARFAFDLPKVGGGSINMVNPEQVIEIVNNKIRIRNPIAAQIQWSNIFLLSSNSSYSGIKLGSGSGLENTPYGHFENSEYFLHFFLQRPIKEQSSSTFWEVGELVSIVDPETEDRAFQAVTLPLHGDCYAQGYTFFEEAVPNHSVVWAKSGNDDQQRIMFPCMSAMADKKRAAFLDAVVTDQGKPTTDVDVTEEKQNGHVVRWSNKYIPGTIVNGLGEFIEANKFVIPSERGIVRKLAITGDNVLLAIHARKITSLGIGQRILKSPTGQDTIVASDETIGYQRPMLLDLGTINPESVVTDGSRVYGFDFNAAEPWRVGGDGLTPLATTYKNKKWFKQKCDQLKAAKALDSDLDIQIVGGVDPYLQMYFLTFKEVSYTVEAVTTIIPAETVGFSELAKGWLDFYDFIPERYVNHGTQILSVKNQKLWLHNADTENHNMFYDVQYGSEVTLVGNMQSDVLKQWDYLSQESNGRWLVTKAITPPTKDNLIGQETDMNSDLCFKIEDGRHYVEFLRDKNTPAAMIPEGKSPRLHGVPMVSSVITVTLRNAEKKEVVLDAVYIGFSPILGHLMTPR